MRTVPAHSLVAAPVKTYEKDYPVRISVFVLLFSLLCSATGLAQDIRYVSGEQRVALRGGPDDDYRIVHRGIAPGSGLTVARTSDDGLWADITTDGGITGWIPTQKLTLEPPPAAPVSPAAAAQPSATSTEQTAGAPAAQGTADGEPAPGQAELLDRINAADEEFNAVAQELHQLKQVSGKAEQLDIDNRRLVEEQENLRSELEMLQADNQRLRDKLDSEDFMNGALAVLLGVIIALVAPRLVPRRRKHSGWA
jgi:SH3 domain protein